MRRQLLPFHHPHGIGHEGISNGFISPCCSPGQHSAYRPSPAPTVLEEMGCLLRGRTATCRLGKVGYRTELGPKGPRLGLPGIALFPFSCPVWLTRSPRACIALWESQGSAEPIPASSPSCSSVQGAGDWNSSLSSRET